MHKSKEHTIYLALGSNIGNKEKNIVKAIELLKEEEKISKISISCLYESRPFGLANQENFFNAALHGITMLSPQELLSFVKSIEKKLGRKVGVINGPREIDIDILFYDDLILKNDTLEIPHPRIPERDFVLKPLIDLDPHMVHSALKESIQILLNNVNEHFLVRKVKTFEPPIPFIDTKNTRIMNYRGLEFIVLPGIFPPYPTLDSVVGLSARNIEMFKEKDVLDLGTGCGVRAIIASMAGAKSVTASDISSVACKNICLNALLHDWKNIHIIQSDLFEHITKTYDAIVAYLPSVDRRITQSWQDSIHDPGYETHKRLIREANKYLKPGGIIHLAFLDEADVALFGYIQKEGYSIIRKKFVENPNGNWNFIDISLKDKE